MNPRPLLLVALLGAAQCTVETDVPAGALIECDSKADCPGSMVCNTVAKRCVPSEALDTEPPFVDGAATVDPPIGTVGTSFTVSFRVNEALDRIPEVGFLRDGRMVLLQPIGTPALDGRSFSFAYTAEAADPEGANALSVVLQDTGFNVTRAALGVNLVFDFTAPDVVSGSATPILLLDPAANPLPQVTEATYGTTIQIILAVDEPVPVTYVPELSVSSPGALPFSMASRSSTGFIFEYVVSSSDDPVDGAYSQFQIRLRDEAGNEEARPFVVDPAFVVDTAPPIEPAVGTQGQVVYHRIPWGSDSTAGSPTFFVSGAGGSVDPEAWVIAYAGIDGRTELGRVQADAAGGFSVLPMNTPDRPLVYLAAADSAGNLSRIVLVRDVQWTATLGQKVAGSALENPHDFEQRRVAAGALWADAIGDPFPSALGQRGGSVRTTRGAGSWESPPWLLPDDGLPARSRPNVAWVDAGEYLLLFGGMRDECVSSAVECAETWEWRGQRWHKLAPADPEGDGNPGPRGTSGMAYDRERARVLMFGGTMTNTSYGDTWEWTGRSWERRCDGLPANDVCAEQPPSRSGALMAHDGGDGTTLLFGGRNATGDCDGSGSNDCAGTWLWDGTEWTRLSPDDPESDGDPEPRTEGGMAYDPVRDRIVMFGGACFASDCINTWEWTGVSWERRCDGVPATDVCTDEPVSCGTGCRLFYDDANSRMLMVNGNADAWSWDGSDWSRLTLGDLEGDGDPTSRRRFGMAFDRMNGQVLLVGGDVWIDPDVVYVNDIWGLRDNSWKLLSPIDPDPEADGQPPPRDYHAMVFDAARGKTLLFGGDGGTTSYSDTWTWDGKSWARESPAASPTGRERHALANDSDRGVVVLFGGSSDLNPRGDTWEWDGSTWEQRCDGAPAGDDCTDEPDPRDGHGMVYDDARNEVVLFGGFRNGATCDSGAGSYCSSTWLWNGIDWRLASLQDPEGDGEPAARREFGLAYDASRQRTVLYGGFRSLNAAAFDDTWEWNGQSWRRITPVDPEGDGDPPPVRAAAMTYDADRQKVVLLSGSEQVESAPGVWIRGEFSEAWEWDGQSWAFVATADPQRDGDPGPRSAASACYDTFRQRAVLFGGNVVNVSNATWEWDGGSFTRPSQVVTIRFGASGGPDPAICDLDPATCPFNTMSAVWSVGGLGGATPGASLWAWEGGAWQAVGTHASEPSLPGDISWAISDPNRIAGLLRSVGSSLYLAVAPNEDNGTASGHGRVSSDYVEVLVGYRLGIACSDRVLNGTEECDDGNLLDGDGCDHTCTVTACGNGVPTEGEQCDDGNFVDGDGCDSDCSRTQCGNGIQTAGESCDDGNLFDNDGCSGNCLLEGGACGDGVHNEGEECDDGDAVEGDGCDSNCTVSACGNGIPGGTEECDDGNATNGDGCDNNCTTPRCGNNEISPGEECDDGNLDDNDGCSAGCFIEGWCGAPMDATANINGASIIRSNLDGVLASFSGCQAGTSGLSHAYAVTPNASGLLTVSTANPSTDFDTVLSAQTTCGVVATELACSNNYMGQPTSQVSFAASAGTTYYLIVSGYNFAIGTYELSLTQ